MAGETRFEPTEADYLAANKVQFHAHIRSRRLWTRLLVVLPGLGILLAAAYTLLGDPPLEALTVAGLSVLLGVPLVFVIFGANYLLLPRRVGRLYRQSKSQHLPMTFAWSDEGICWSSSQGEFRLPWHHFHRWIEASSCYLLYLNDSQYQYVPRRALSSEEDDDLKATLMAHGPSGR